jgi:hypothetical protein
VFEVLKKSLEYFHDFWSYAPDKIGTDAQTETISYIPFGQGIKSIIMRILCHRILELSYARGILFTQIILQCNETYEEHVPPLPKFMFETSWTKQ